jgi:hypothetical protein
MRNPLSVLLSLILGLVFGYGLIVSGMTDNAKVLGFLDLFGRWQPALALVMGAGVITALPFFLVARRRSVGILGGVFSPLPQKFDGNLIGGSALFGIGWGIAGLCPGPAVVWIGFNPLAIAPFMITYFLGAFVAQKFIAARVKSDVNKSHEPDIQKA